MFNRLLIVCQLYLEFMGVFVHYSSTVDVYAASCHFSKVIFSNVFWAFLSMSFAAWVCLHETWHRGAPHIIHPPHLCTPLFSVRSTLSISSQLAGIYCCYKYLDVYTPLCAILCHWINRHIEQWSALPLTSWTISTVHSQSFTANSFTLLWSFVQL